jgi:dipeptidyl aminopeptidase/acylaminoacyl peptidase
VGRTALTAGLGVLASAVVPAPAAASFPGGNGRLAFSTATGSPPGNIFTMTASGRHRRRLTAEGDSRNPAWSRDGRRIAFDRSRGRKRAIYVMDRNGSGRRRVPTGEVQAENPAWSPDGRTLVFQGCRRAGNCARTGIYAVHLWGAGLRRIAPNGSDPVWSPNGRWIAYHGKVARSDPCATLVRVRPSGRRRRAILSRRKDRQHICSRGGGGADFSPNGRRLVYHGLHAAGFQQYVREDGRVVRVWTYDPAMYTVRFNGKRKRRLVTRPLQNGGFFALPFVWSPKGDRLLWRDDRGAFTSNTRARQVHRVGGRAGVGYAWQRRPR